jgi:hypothetical protein
MAKLKELHKRGLAGRLPEVLDGDITIAVYHLSIHRTIKDQRISCSKYFVELLVG